MEKFKRTNANAWVSKCGCRKWQESGGWSPALKNGDETRDNAGNWVAIDCPVVTVKATINEQTSPVFSGANVQFKNQVTGEIYNVYTGTDSHSFNDVYEGHAYTIEVLNDAGDHSNGVNAQIHIKIYKNLDEVAVHDVVISGNLGDPSDVFLFVPQPGDTYNAVIDVTADAPTSGGNSDFTITNNANIDLNWQIVSGSNDVQTSGTLNSLGTIDVSSSLRAATGVNPVFQFVISLADTYSTIDQPTNEIHYYYRDTGHTLSELNKDAIDMLNSNGVTSRTIERGS